MASRENQWDGENVTIPGNLCEDAITEIVDSVTMLGFVPSSKILCVFGCKERAGNKFLDACEKHKKMIELKFLYGSKAQLPENSKDIVDVCIMDCLWRVLLDCKSQNRENVPKFILLLAGDHIYADPVRELRKEGVKILLVYPKRSIAGGLLKEVSCCSCISRVCVPKGKIVWGKPDMQIPADTGLTSRGGGRGGGKRGSGSKGGQGGSASRGGRGPGPHGPGSKGGRGSDGSTQYVQVKSSSNTHGNVTHESLVPGESIRFTVENVAVTNLKSGYVSVGINYDSKGTKDNVAIGSDIDRSADPEMTNASRLESSAKDGLQVEDFAVKQRAVKGVEASYAIKCANTTVKRKMDERKEGMLGKKRNRQTMFLNLEDVKQPSSVKTLTPRRQNSAQSDSHAANPPAEHDLPSNDGIHLESSERKSESNDESYSGLRDKPRRLNEDGGSSAEWMRTSVSRQASWKQPTNSRQPNSGHSSGRTVSYSQSSYIKPATTRNQYQDTSVKRLIREVTNEKFWRHPGWYDVILLSLNGCKWAFKEGEVAVLSYLVPDSAVFGDQEHHEEVGRVAGTVRRHIPIDTRDPLEATLHFYVGESLFDSMTDDSHILRNLKPKDIWHLTVLGSLATTQREYIALHAFSQLNPQMQNAILNPSPEQFPSYEVQTPAMPDCFTTSFVDHLHRSFNAPQLAAIHWAAIHTAAGTSSGVKKQEPWPFTLIQGPPKTGKTHTLWGMLTVIHLVQYQQYYPSLLKKLAPESYGQATESGSENILSGSIDEILQSMDQNLFRTLPKLCAKPRMLVCAPSNAATDELLSLLLDRGFIDGEMRVYRPDVTRVGVDSQMRAAQAVSVERRSFELFAISRDEILQHMYNLRLQETQISRDIARLKRELNAAAFATRSQGSVGVDPEVLISRGQKRDALLQHLSVMVEARDKVLVEMSGLVIVEGKLSSGGRVGFVSDIRRMNFALTGARRALWVMGNASALMKSDDWAALITDARKRNCFMEIDSLPQNFPLPTVPVYNPKAPNARGFRSGGPNTKYFETQNEPSSAATIPEDNEKLNTLTTFAINDVQRDRSLNDSHETCAGAELRMFDSTTSFGHLLQFFVA